MAKADKPLLSLGARGTISDSLTFQKRRNRSSTIARRKPIPTDPKSEAQLAQRQKYRDAVDAWHALSPEEQQAWRGVCPGLTAYQCFIRSELRKVVVPPEEYTEEQLEHNRDQAFRDGSYTWIGQRLTISNRQVTKLGLWLSKYGLPTGNITYQIRRVSDDGLIMEKVLCDASELTTDPTYYELTFDTPTIINEEVRILAYFPYGDGSNAARFGYKDSDVKANEYVTYKHTDTWAEATTLDATYRYKYYLP